jgi:hypothetical protein
MATIRTTRLLSGELKAMNIRQLSTRNLNQDPIENLFNVVRQNCGSNHCPNAEQFVAALKTAVTNGLLSCKSNGNTAPDGCTLLTDLRNFFYEGSTSDDHSTTQFRDLKI